MTLAFTLLLLAAALYYAALMVFFAVGFRRVRHEAAALTTGSAGPAEEILPPRVSVVIPARNEQAHIEACLHAVLSNTYPPERFEVIVVDDASDDATASLVRAVQRRYDRAPVGADGGAAAEPPRIRLLQRVDPTVGGTKHHALRYGLDHARGDILLTTDADCLVGPRWIETMTACFSSDTGFVAGPVRYRPGRTFFGRLQALEFLGLVATGAGGIGMGHPNMCNSANVAYRRAVYERYGSLRSADPAGPGEDEGWAQRLAAETPWRVRFCADPDALVETDPLLDLRAFWTQRRRWAGTGPRYPRRGVVAVIVGVYLFYVLLLAGLVAAWFAPALWPAVLAASLLKVGAEVALLYPACTHFGQPRLFRYFWPGHLLQIPYVVFVGAAAAAGSPTWKGRTVYP